MIIDKMDPASQRQLYNVENRFNFDTKIVSLERTHKLPLKLTQLVLPQLSFSPASAKSHLIIRNSIPTSL